MVKKGFGTRGVADYCIIGATGLAPAASEQTETGENQYPDENRTHLEPNSQTFPQGFSRERANEAGLLGLGLKKGRTIGSPGIGRSAPLR